MSQTERLYWIDSQIRTKAYPNADTVAGQFGVSTRTAYADRDYLKERLHAPLCFDRQRGGWNYSDHTFVLPLLALTVREAAALHRTLLIAHEYLGALEAEPVRLLAERLAQYLPELRQGGGDESVSGALHPSSNVSAPVALLQDCRDAIRTRRRIRLLYYSVGRDALWDRVVQPYHLRNHSGEEYLVAWCERRQDWRVFFLGRMREWHVQEPEGAFVTDPAFDAEAYFRQGLALRHGEAVVEVIVQFTPYQARWIRERRYHPTQQTEDLPNGGLRLSLRVAGTFEVKRWLLGYGAEVEVLEPAALRDEIAADTKKLAQIYAAPGH